MGKKDQTVRVSSKGQIVIPVAVRRAMGLALGGELRVRLESPRKLVLMVPEYDDTALEQIFQRAHKWTRQTGRDLVEELHERRRRERAAEAKRREPGRRQFR
jgi:AbrB family looped-hinge helix DNA binding protein